MELGYKTLAFLLSKIKLYSEVEIIAGCHGWKLALVGLESIHKVKF